MTTPTNEQLLERCLNGTLGTEELELAKSGTGPHAEQLRATMRFAALIREAQLEAPPSRVKKAALAAGEPKGLGTQLKTWVASLVPSQSELRPAFRGAADVPSLYQAGPFELDLLRMSSGALVGELAPCDDTRPLPKSGLACLFGRQGVRTGFVADGEFRIEDVEPGDYRLVLDLALDEAHAESIVITDLKL